MITLLAYEFVYGHWQSPFQLNIILNSGSIQYSAKKTWNATYAGDTVERFYRLPV